MKIKKDFTYHTVGGQHVVVPVGAASRDFNGMIRLNEVGAFLWKFLENGAETEDLIREIMNEYDLDDEARARADVEAFVKSLQEVGILE